MDLPKTTAFVSGANRGLGKHLADQLTSRGAIVHGGARKPGTLDTSTGVIPRPAGHHRSRLSDSGRGSRSRYHS